MKKIIVPTDFSYASKDAFLFALNVASELGASVDVVHIYSDSFSQQQPYSTKSGRDRHESLLDDLKNFSTLKKEGEVLVKADIKIGFQAIGGVISEELLKLSEDKETLMLIMGMTGAGIPLEQLFGTISMEVSQKASCPVLLIPKESNFSGFENMLYASDYNSVTTKLLKRAVDFSIPFKSILHFIHVQEKETDLNIELEDKLFNFLFSNGDPIYTLNMASIDSKSVTKGLNQYIEENEIDLTIMVTHHRNFWERIIHKSITHEMAVTTKVPILVFHEED